MKAIVLAVTKIFFKAIGKVKQRAEIVIPEFQSPLFFISLMVDKMTGLVATG